MTELSRYLKEQEQYGLKAEYLSLKQLNKVAEMGRVSPHDTSVHFLPGKLRNIYLLDSKNGNRERKELIRNILSYSPNKLRREDKIRSFRSYKDFLCVPQIALSYQVCHHAQPMKTT